MADIIHGRESLLFMPNHHPQRNQTLSLEFISAHESINEEDPDEQYSGPDSLYVHHSPQGNSESDEEGHEDADSVHKSGTNQGGPPMLIINTDIHKSDVVDNIDKICDGNC